MKALFSPGYPDKEFYTIVAIFMHLGYVGTMDPADDFDFAMAWQDCTWLDEQPLLQRIARDKPVLNLGCSDISKRKVERVFHAVFGYATFVDPTRYRGRCVQKYDENARGGTIIGCPVRDVDARFVYQRLIDAVQDDWMVEYRVPVICDALPVVYVQQKVIPRDTIKTEKIGLQLAAPGDVFSGGEIAAIGDFCRGMGLDFGELDILRDRDDGRIYILDANKTPGGFGILNKMKWRPEQRRAALELLAAAFDAGVRKRRAAA